MKIYIEQVLITNFIIDYCIMLIVSKLILPKSNYRHIVLSSMFGSVSSMVTPYCTNIIILNALKILSAIIMLQLLHIQKKQMFKSILLMLALSYIIGGAVLSNFGTGLDGGYIIKLNNLIPVFIITIISTLICCKLITWLKSKINTNSYIHNTTLINNNTKINIKGFLDSGNGLLDNNKPVNLINFDTFNKLTGITLNQYLNQQFSSLNNPHFISASTIAGKQKILVFTINELHFNSKIFKDVQVGVSLHFDNSKEYKVILNSSFCLN